MKVRYLWSLCLVVLVLLAGLSCSSSGDAEQVAGALEDRVTEALDFEGGEIKEGEPPAAGKDEELPQISQVEAPDKFYPGADFTALLTSEYDMPEAVSGAIVHIQGASKYIVVEKTLLERVDFSFMELRGTLKEDTSLAGESFTLRFALQHISGEVGEYQSRSMEVPEQAAEPDCTEGPCCNGGIWVSEGETCAYDADDLFCTDGLCTADHTCESALASAYCLISDICQPEDSISGDNSCKLCDPERDKADWSDALDGSSCDLPDAAGSGLCQGGSCKILAADGDTDGDVEQEGIEPDGDKDPDPEAENEAAPPDGDANLNLCEPDPCNGLGTCNQLDGSCECDLGFTGDACERCELGMRGFYPDCMCEFTQCYAINPTGQIDCYGVNLATACIGGVDNVDCSSVPLDCDTNITDSCYCGQDAQYQSTENERIFTCYDASGLEASCSLLVSPNENEVVVDNLTDLMWQRALPTLFDGCTLGVPAGSNCSWQEAVAYCENLTYASQTDWRLPTPFDLRSLVNAAKEMPCIDEIVFPQTPAERYWTSLPSSLDENLWALVVDFVNGYSVDANLENENFARCVRWADGSRGSRADGERFTISGTDEEVVTDVLTGLIWLPVNIVIKEWWQALNYCETLQYANKDDWRLPDRNELASLLNHGRDQPASDFPGMRNSSFFSSTTLAGSGGTPYAWIVNFTYGHVDTNSKVNQNEVLCVRGGANVSADGDAD